jgi:hypothetical protein
LNLDSAAVADSSALVESDPAANNPVNLCGCLEELLHDTAGNDLRKSAAGQGKESPESKVAPESLKALAGRWVLVAVLAPPGESAAGASRSQLVLVESMLHQFASLGLGSIVVPAHSVNQAELQQWRTDWNFDPAIEIDATNATGLRKTESTAETRLLLLSPSGQVAASWQFPVPPADVWLQIQRHLGTPAGTQQMPACPRPVL